MIYNGKDINEMSNQELANLKLTLDKQYDRLMSKQSEIKFKKIVSDNPINPAFITLRDFVTNILNERNKNE